MADLKREYAGVPLWGWLGAAGVVLLGYVWIRHHQSSSASAGGTGAGAGGGGGKSTDNSTFRETVKDLQSSPAPAPSTGSTGSHEGPEREWLERKTGSEHPWTWLQRHHETIAVGPHGSRRIVHKKG